MAACNWRSAGAARRSGLVILAASASPRSRAANGARDERAALEGRAEGRAGFPLPSKLLGRRVEAVLGLRREARVWDEEHRDHHGVGAHKGRRDVDVARAARRLGFCVEHVCDLLEEVLGVGAFVARRGVDKGVGEARPGERIWGVARRDAQSQHAVADGVAGHRPRGAERAAKVLGGAA